MDYSTKPARNSPELVAAAPRRPQVPGTCGLDGPEEHKSTELAAAVAIPHRNRPTRHRTAPRAPHRTPAPHSALITATPPNLWRRPPRRTTSARNLWLPTPKTTSPRNLSRWSAYLTGNGQAGRAGAGLSGARGTGTAKGIGYIDLAHSSRPMSPPVIDQGKCTREKRDEEHHLGHDERLITGCIAHTVEDGTERDVPLIALHARGPAMS
jgi:hypothetical protein